MSSVSVRRKPGTATIEDLLALPEDDRYELVDGELEQKEAGTGRHGETQGRTYRILGPFDRKLGTPGRPGGWRFAVDATVDFGDRNVRLPDIAGWRRERLAEMPTEVPIRVVPDWIAEVVSASNASNDTVEKMRLYHARRVPHYWLLDPRDQTLTVYRYTPEGYLVVLSAGRGEKVRAEPFDAVELSVNVLFGEDEEE